MTAGSAPGTSRIGVVGCGVMGAGVAEICAVAGLDVHVAVSGPDSADRGRARVDAALERAVHKGRIEAACGAKARSLITFRVGLDDLRDRDLVVECVPEDERRKLAVFHELDRIAGPDCILASNTSSLSITRLARATTRPDRVIGTHFFNPVAALPLVELGVSPLTSELTYRRVADLMTGSLGKEVIRSTDRAGFVVNALLVPYLMSAIRMVEAGIAGPADIDTGMTRGCGHPMGPLRLADLIGLDALRATARGLFEEYQVPWYAPPPLLCRMVDDGILGRKSGQGFYDYA